MLEQGPVLKTFRMDIAPGGLASDPVELQAINDHALRFLDYQGPVNKGQGMVRIVDLGSYTTIEMSQSCWTILIEGTLLRGRYMLSHQEGDRWLFSRA